MGNALSLLRPAGALTVVLTALLAIVHPLVLWSVSHLFFPSQASGSLVVRDGTVVGSSLIGQAFAGERYFHPRPSAAGSGYDATASGGTNLGPGNEKLLKGVHGSEKPDGTPDPASDFDGVEDLARAYRSENGLGPADLVPVDAVTRSGSGLDPHIGRENARLQIARVARARGMSPEAVRALVEGHTQGRQLGVLGEPRVNVLLLNLALDDAASRAATASK